MSYPSLAGGVAVVTGAAGGLGSASARRLAAEGVRLVLVDVDGDRLGALAATLTAELVADLPAEIECVVADVATEEGVDAYTAAGLARFGRLDYHHLNAGISGSLAPIPELSVEDFDSVIAVNLRGVFLGVRAAFRQYAAQSPRGPAAGRSGSHQRHEAIVITASIASLRGSADLLPYQTSKHGVLGILRGAAVYGGPLGIRVNAVAPGIVPTELFAGAATTPGGRNDMVQRALTTPLRRAGTGADIAGVAAFLLSEDAAYMTGEVVSADGGAAAVSTVRPSGGAGAWDTSRVDRLLYGDPPDSRPDDLAQAANPSEASKRDREETR